MSSPTQTAPLLILLCGLPLLAQADIQFGTAGPANNTYQGCDPNTPIDVEITPDFNLLIRNCSAEADVSALIRLGWSTPPPEGIVGEPKYFGVQEALIEFTQTGQEMPCPILEVGHLETGEANGDNNIIDVVVTAFSRADGGTGLLKIGDPVNVQRAEDPNYTSFISKSDLAPVLDRQVIMRTLVDPVGGFTPSTGKDESCWAALADAHHVVVENSGGINILAGTVFSKVLCLSDVGNCAASGATATHSGQVTLGLAPEACVRTPTAPPTNFNDCCDPMVNIIAPDHQARHAQQCAKLRVTQVSIDTVVMTIQPAYESPWIQDTEPSLIAVASFDTDQFSPAGCDAFSANFPAKIAEFNCDFGGLFQDRDTDSIIDACDHLIGPFREPSGSMKGMIVPHFRMKDFSDTPFDEAAVASITSVLIDGQPVSSFTVGVLDTDFKVQERVIEFTIDSALAPGNYDVTVIPATGPAATARDSLIIPKPAFVAAQAGGHLARFDELTGRPLDTDPSFAESIIDLPAAPYGVTFSTQAGNLNNELYATAGDSFLVITDSATGVPSITQSVVIAPDVGPLELDVDGRFAFVLHGTGDIGVVQVDTGASTRFAAFPAVAAVLGTGSQLVVHNLEPADANPRFAVYATSSCIGCGPGTSTCPTSISQGKAEPPGTLSMPPPSALAVSLLPPLHVLGALSSALLPRNVLRLLQTCEPGSCEFLLLPPEGGGDGGGGSSSTTREVWLGTRVLRANTNGSGNVTSWTLECQVDRQISSLGVINASAPVWDQLGLDLNNTRTELYVVSPETNELVRFDTSTNTETGRVVVGTFPFDVQVMNVVVPLLGLVERAYVVNHGDGGVLGDDTISIVNPASFTSGQVISISVNDDFPSTEPDNFPVHLHLERIAATETFTGGQVQSDHLYLVSGITNRVFGYRLSPNAEAPTRLTAFAAGPNPGNIAFQKAVSAP